MMMNGEDRTRQYLEDIVTNCEMAARLVERGREAFTADEMLQAAAAHVLTQCGEDVRRIDDASQDFVSSHPDLELRDLKNARNFMVHEYDDVSPDVLWEILELDLPRVCHQILLFLSGT
jgi:uncharacterized protein with HEPN domain